MSATVKIARTCGEEVQTVAAFIAAQADNAPPLLACAEPRTTALNENGGAGRRTDFHPLVADIPQWPADLPLAEAYLFWKDAVLHAVAKEDGGCRWARIDEARQGTEDVARTETPVLTLRDWQRFGLEKAPCTDKLIAIEYRAGGRLIAWRLIPGGETENA